MSKKLKSKTHNLKPNIYLDYAASTPVSERVLEAMQPYFSDNFANPSALHMLGQKARGVLDNAKSDIADVIGANWKEIIFTASATESINLALRGVIKTLGQAKDKTIKKPHVITTNIEHSASLETCCDLEKEGVEITYLSINKDGLISSEQVRRSIKENTVLVSIAYVNNVIGTIQPINEISDIIKNLRKSETKSGYPIFHIDAVQAENYLDINVKNLGVDLMTISSHKIYGPKGSAALYRKENVQLAPLVTGGNQERGYHSGTENLPAIVGFAEAIKETEEIKEKESKRIKELQDFFIDNVLKDNKNISLNGSRQNRIPNNINLCFPDKKIETLIPKLDAYGIYASGGSACMSHVLKSSYIIEAIGKKECAKSSVRFSLGRGTKKEDLEYVIEKIKDI